MYRWVDDHNNVIFSDKKPLDQTKLRIESLNKNAKVVAVVEKEKSPEQQALDQHFLRLRNKQQSVINHQKKQDRALLSNFHSIQELQLALQDKVTSFDLQRNVVLRNLDRLKDQLRQQQKFAAQFERDGKNIPKRIATNIASSQSQIKDTESDITNRLKQKEETQQKFDNDIARFTFLTQSKISTRKHVFDTAIKAKNETELGLYTCTSIQVCDQAWQIAKQFITTHSTTGLYLTSDKLIISRDPSQKADLSLSISKESLDHNQQRLFLDIRCHASSIGKERCHSQKVKNIRHSFNHFIKTALAAN